MAYPLDNALFQWEEGTRRLRELSEDPRVARTARRAVDAIRDELRRRIGPTFTAQELADHYGDGTSWADDLAGMESWVVDAAFHRYLREAKNFAGGELVL